MGRYEAYHGNRRKNRGWQVMENDKTEDGRYVAGDLTEDDCNRIVRLLNADEDEQKRRANDDEGFRPEVM
ncbi:MAG: hypothetical protein V3T11_10005 [Roseateles sp.]